jgi:hypothetical protein
VPDSFLTVPIQSGRRDCAERAAVGVCLIAATTPFEDKSKPRSFGLLVVFFGEVHRFLPCH